VGLSWDFEWDLNGDQNWRSYETYASKNGEGGRVGSLKAGDVVRIREKSKSGWSATTRTEQSVTLEDNHTSVVKFGNRQPTTIAQSTPTPTPAPTLPKAGSVLQSAVVFAAGTLVTILGIIGFLAL